MAAAIESIVTPAVRRSSRRSIAANQPIEQTTSPSKTSTIAVQAAASSSTSIAKRSRVQAEPDTDAPTPVEASAPTRVNKTKRSVKQENESPARHAVKDEDGDDAISDAKPSAPKKRRTKKELEEENEIFPTRPSPHAALANAHAQNGDRRGSGLFIGAHISSAGGVENAPLNALRIGGNAFSCFVRPKMQWASNPIPDSSAESFKQRVAHHSFMPSHSKMMKSEESVKQEPNGESHAVGDGYVVPHGCYLVNLANPDAAKRDKSFEAFIDDLQRCEQLGIKLFNFHPGSMTAASALNDDPAADKPLPSLTSIRTAKAEACALVASYINRAHSLTSSVIILAENMAGSKNDTILGSSLHDLCTILSHVTDKSRVGVCIDTCHAFAAGYDLTTPAAYAAFADQIDTTIGWQTVKAMHLNDSKFGVGCRRDRHENIGRGHVGLGGFWSIVNDRRWNGIPLILETPALGNAMSAYKGKEGQVKMHEVWSYQIQALYALRGTKWGEWKEAEDWLQKADVVVAEAEKLHAAKKSAKGEGAAKKPKGKAKKKKAESEDEEGASSSELSDDA